MFFWIEHADSPFNYPNQNHAIGMVFYGCIEDREFNQDLLIFPIGYYGD